MKRSARHKPVLAFLRDEAGAAMVEFAIVCTLFFLSFFQLFDFGLFASNNLMAEKATQIATRIAIVRPPVCAGVPARHEAGTDTSQRFGTNCRAAANVCAAEATVSCAGSSTNATATEIWDRVSPTLPSGTEIADLTFTYAFDPNLGYLGGPYTPMVTVELTLADFEFVSPITEWAIHGTSTGTTGMQYRVISITMPGEDLALATDG